MASASDNISCVSHSLNAFTQINSTMEECSDENNVNSLNVKENFNRILVEYDQQHQGSHRKAWTSERISEVINEIKKAQVTMSSGQRRTSMDYYWMSKYDIMRTANEDYLIFKRLNSTGATVRILPREQYYDILSDIHASCGHGGRDKILTALKNRYYIPKKAVEIFMSLCPVCETKKIGQRKDNKTKPIVSRDVNLRGQFDLIDFQSCPDREFEWLLKYQDDATKFLNLRPLKTKRAVEVASELMKIFLVFGAPSILQSDNGQEFNANVIKELAVMWPDCKIVHEDPRRPQSPGSVDSSNQDVENMLQAWMNENKSTNWSIGCYFVQYLKNSSFHQKIGRSPYKALFGSEPTPGLSESNIPTSILLTVKIEPNEATSSDYDNNDNNSKTIMEHSVQFESNFTCAVCHKEAPGAYKCESCNTGVDAICGITEGDGSKVVCVMSKVEMDINVERDSANKELKRAAEEMTDTTVKKMPKLDIGNSVLVSVPKVDRGTLNMKYIQGIIVDIKNGVHRVGTKYGTIKNWFSRKELQYSDTNYGEEISETPISLGEAVTCLTCQSPASGPGFQKCGCKPAVNQCRNNRCACFKNKVLCGFKCHGNLTCVNK